MPHGLTGSVWSLPARSSSPWLMSLVHGVPVKVTSVDRANGLLSVAAGCVQVPATLGEVHERNQRLPSEPIASTSSEWPGGQARNFQGLRATAPYSSVARSSSGPASGAGRHRAHGTRPGASTSRPVR
jgi:hypothetical protein